MSTAFDLQVYVDGFSFLLSYRVSYLYDTGRCGMITIRPASLCCPHCLQHIDVPEHNPCHYIVLTMAIEESDLLKIPEMYRNHMTVRSAGIVAIDSHMRYCSNSSWISGICSGSELYPDN